MQAARHPNANATSIRIKFVKNERGIGKKSLSAHACKNLRKLDQRDYNGTQQNTMLNHSSSECQNRKEAKYLSVFARWPQDTSDFPKRASGIDFGSIFGCFLMILV